MRARELPADLIKEWAQRQTAASAKLEGRELPQNYVRPQRVEDYLQQRAAPRYSKSIIQRNASGEICVVMDDE